MAYLDSLPVLFHRVWFSLNNTNWIFLCIFSMRQIFTKVSTLFLCISSTFIMSNVVCRRFVPVLMSNLITYLSDLSCMTCSLEIFLEEVTLKSNHTNSTMHLSISHNVSFRAEMCGQMLVFFIITISYSFTLATGCCICDRHTLYFSSQPVPGSVCRHSTGYVLT